MKNESQDKLLKNGEVLPIMEKFYTVQGEGVHTGKPAYFLRIGGCDVGCKWCDVKGSWNAKKHPPVQTQNIVNNVAKYSDTVVVTGGEPLTWNLNYLTNQLKSKNINTHIETSGCYPLTGIWDWICLSPKKNKLPQESIYSKVNELKVIIFNKSDFLFAEKQSEKVNTNCALFLQPEWSKREEITPQIVEYILKNPKWKISIQTHKILNIP